MTKIKNEQRIAIEALKNAGIGYGAIGKQLELKKSTVAKHIQTKSLIAQIGPKVKFSRAAINGRKSLRVKNFIKCNPLATLADIKMALDLEVSKKTISVFLKKEGLQARVAKKKIVAIAPNYHRCS
jgi:IS30 family transposase